MEKIAKEDRKITSDKFTITVPKDWRDSHGLKPGNSLTPFYQDHSPLVLIPKGMELDDLEIQLITLITSYKNMKGFKKLTEDLQKLMDQIEEI